MNSYFRNLREEMAAFLPADYRTALEVGCGEGEFHRQLRPGTEVWGVEPNPQAAGIAAGKLHKVLVGPYELMAAEIPDNHFDLVICNDVIEHMSDPGRFLQSVREKMKPGACIIGSIPNVRFALNLFNLLIRKDWRYEDEGVLDRTHLRFFTIKSVGRLLGEQQFQVELIRGINPPKIVWKKVVMWTLTLASLGQLMDSQCMQIGFRARRQ